MTLNKPIKALISCALLFIISSCGRTKTEIERDNLIAENEALRLELNEFKKRWNNLQPSSLVMPRSATLTLGEEYLANVFMLLHEKGNGNVVDFYDIKGNSYIRDTLTFIEEGHDYGYSEVIFTPQDTGKYEFKGRLKKTILDKEFDLPCYFEFKVINP